MLFYGYTGLFQTTKRQSETKHNQNQTKKIQSKIKTAQPNTTVILLNAVFSTTNPIIQ